MTMAVKKTTKTVKSKPAKAVTGIKIPVVGVDGKAAGSMTLPEQFFGVKPNKQLLAQAIRVYLANQRVGHAATKTRGQVEGSTRKIYRQKGTGRARHGAIRAPIFVGGGIVFGPQPRDYSLKFPQKMRRAALASSLSQQQAQGNIIVVSGLSDMAPKTKNMALALGAIGAAGSTLLVVSGAATNIVRAARNIAQLDVLPVADIHAYGVVTHKKVIFMKEAVGALK